MRTAAQDATEFMEFEAKSFPEPSAISYNPSKHRYFMKFALTATAVCAFLLSTACMQSPEKLIATGNRYHDKKKFKEASILYQKAIAKDKTNAEAYYREGLNLIDSAYQDPAAYGEAIKFLRRAIDLKPENTDAETKLAEIYLAAYASNPNQYKNFLTEIKDLDAKILQHDPNSFDGIRIQGMINLAENDRTTAIQNFEKANRIRPHSRDLISWYAEALSQAQRGPEAEALVRDMLASDKTWAPGYDFLFLLYSRQNDKAKAESILRERVKNDPASPVAVQNLGNYLLANNRFDEAEAEMKPVLNDKKNFPGGREMLGDFYMRSRKFDLALQQYQSGLKEDSKNAVPYQQRIVAVYEATNRHGEALQLAKKVADENPKDKSATEVYAALLMQNNSKEAVTKSVDDLKRMLQNNPNDGALHFQLARAYFGIGQPDKSLSEALEAIRDESKERAPKQAVILGARTLAGRVYADKADSAKALEQADAVLAVAPKNPDARLIRDRALVGMNQADKATTELEALVKDFPTMNDAHLQLAGLYMMQKQLERSYAEFEKVWKANPPDNRGYVGMQAVKLAQGKGGDAVAALKDLVDKNPSVPAYRMQLASFETTAGAQQAGSNPTAARQLFQSAADNYQELLKTNSNSSDTWVRLGMLQRQLGNYDQAISSFEQAVKVDPKNVNAMLNEAMLLELQGKKDKAGETYNRILGLDPENWLALNNMAFLNADDGKNLDQAMTWAERAKKKQPNSPEISDTLGYVYLKKNRNAEALQIFKQVVQESPKNSTFHLHLAMALLKEGDKQGARNEAQKALESSTAPEQQSKIRSFVDQIG
ncbi:MAG: tetratricopeptide repeat protein [Bryobacteraceae bacterium]